MSKSARLLDFNVLAMALLPPLLLSVSGTALAQTKQGSLSIAFLSIGPNGVACRYNDSIGNHDKSKYYAEANGLPYIHFKRDAGLGRHTCADVYLWMG